MMSKRDYVLHALIFFKNRGLETEKILLQKAIYAFDFSREPIDMIFEAYTYGPFCKEIGGILREMEMDDVLEVNGDKICLAQSVDEKNFVLDEGDRSRLNNILEIFFHDILGGNTSFKNVELCGTVMYVMDVLNIENDFSNEPPVLDEVVKEVRRWKLKKFGEDKISDVYGRIISKLWQIRNVA